MLKLFGIDINLTKIAIYLGGALIVAALAVGGYFYWKHSIKKQAQLEFNNKQLEQVIKDQAQRLDQLNKINKNQEDIINQLTKEKLVLDDKLKNLDGYLNSADARKDDRPASNVLKQTVKELIGASK